MIIDFYNVENKTNNYYKKLFDEIPEIVFVFEISLEGNFNIKLVSDAIIEMFELSKNNMPDAVMPFFYKTIHKEDRIKALRFLVESRKNQKRMDLELRILLPTKGMRWFKVTSKAEKQLDESIVFYGSILDITDISFQKEKELELISTMESYSEYNSRLVNFSYIVSHNLNSHAGNIKALLDMIRLEDKQLEDSEALSYLRTVSDDLNETIANLSQIVNVQNNLNVTKEPLNLNFYLEKNRNIINNHNHDNKATIINNVAKGTIVNFNPAYLESTLLNFSTNAIKYAHPDRFPIIEFNFFVEKGKKVLTITDNGLGIDLERYGDLLFGMYKTFHKHDKAHGIGLYITKNQVESMNGKISVESKVGEGSTFKIIFGD